MLFGCLLSSRYTFQADVYKKTFVTSPSGQQKTTWSVDKTIDCVVQAIIEGGLRSIGTTERFDERYYNIDWVKLTSREALRRGDRVTNIRQKGTNVPIWVEEELKGKPATWFNANGSAPITDPTGRVVEYQTLLERPEVQGSGS